MRKIRLLAMLLLTGLTAVAQLPQSFSFQAVLRGNNGALVVNEQITVKIRLLADAANGPEVYAETHSVRTNVQGVFVLNVGEGEALSGSMSAVRYDTPLFIEPQVKRSGASDFVVMRAQQVFASPYTAYAPQVEEANRIPSTDYVQTAQEVLSAVSINGTSARSNEPVFVVNNSQGKPLFAVYENGVATGISADGQFTIYDINTGAALLSITQDSTRLSIDDSSSGRPQRAGFFVGGLDGTRAGRVNYLSVTSDETAIAFQENYVEANARPQRAGFFVGGLDGTRPEPNAYLSASDTGIRFAFREHRNTSRPQRAGFMVGGLDGTRATVRPILEVGSDSTAIYFDKSADNSRPQRAGFFVGGLDGTRAGAIDYLSVAPNAVAIVSDSMGTNMVTNQVVSGFDVGGISQQQQDYTSYISVAYNQTTTPAIQTSSADQQGNLKEQFDPNVVEDQQGFKYASAAVGNHRWLRTNLRQEWQSAFWKEEPEDAVRDSINGIYYMNGQVGMCPEGYHVATRADWDFLFDYTKQYFGLTDGEIPGKLLNESAFGLHFSDMGYAEYDATADKWVVAKGYLFYADSAGSLHGLNINENINWDPYTNPDGLYYPIRCVQGSELPVVYASKPDEVMTQSALLTATIKDNGGMPLNDYGFIISGQGGEQKISCKGGPFRSRVTGLTRGEAYTVYAYASNNIGEFIEQPGQYLQMNNLPTVEIYPSDKGYIAQLGQGDNIIRVKAMGICYGSQSNPTILNNCIYSDDFYWLDTVVPGKPGGTTFVRAFAICANDEVVYSTSYEEFYTPALPLLNITSVAVQCSTAYPFTNELRIEYANVIDKGWDFHEISVVRINGVEFPRGNYWSLLYNQNPDTGTIVVSFNALWSEAPMSLQGDHLGAGGGQQATQILTWESVKTPTALNVEIGVGRPNNYYYSDAKQYTLQPVGVKTACDMGEDAVHAEGTTLISYQCGFDLSGVEQLQSNNNYQLYLLYKAVGSTQVDSILWERSDCYMDPDTKIEYCSHGPVHIGGLEANTEYELWPVLLYGVPSATNNEFAIEGKVPGNHSFVRTLDYGSLTDERDGNTYRTVTILGMEWMAENLRYAPNPNDPNSSLKDFTENDLSWGREAGYKTVSPTVDKGQKEYVYNLKAVSGDIGICPEGWGLPTHDTSTYGGQSLDPRGDFIDMVNLFDFPGNDIPWAALIDTSKWENGVFYQHFVRVVNPFGFGAIELELPLQQSQQPQQEKGAAWWGVYYDYSNGTEEKVYYVPYEIGNGRNYKGASVRCVRNIGRH